MKEETALVPHIPSHTKRSASADKDSQQAERVRRNKSVRMDFAMVFGTPEGRRVLQWVFRESGYSESQVGGNPSLGMDVLQGTLYNSARRSLYIEMRKLIPHEILKTVEFEVIEEELI